MRDKVVKRRCPRLGRSSAIVLAQLALAVVQGIRDVALSPRQELISLCELVAELHLSELYPSPTVFFLFGLAPPSTSSRDQNPCKFFRGHRQDAREEHLARKMVRKLKYHEQKLLKKVDFVSYKKNEHRDAEICRRYMIQKPEDYHKYNRLCGVRPPLVPFSLNSPLLTLAIPILLPQGVLP